MKILRRVPMTVHMRLKNKNYKRNKVTRLSPEKREQIRAQRERGILDRNIKRVPKEVQELVSEMTVETLETLTCLGTDRAIRAMERKAETERDRVLEEMITQGWWDE